MERTRSGQRFALFSSLRCAAVGEEVGALPGWRKQKLATLKILNYSGPSVGSTHSLALQMGFVTKNKVK